MPDNKLPPHAPPPIMDAASAFWKSFRLMPLRLPGSVPVQLTDKPVKAAPGLPEDYLFARR